VTYVTSHHISISGLVPVLLLYAQSHSTDACENKAIVDTVDIRLRPHQCVTYDKYLVFITEQHFFFGIGAVVLAAMRVTPASPLNSRGAKAKVKR